MKYSCLYKVSYLHTSSSFILDMFVLCIYFIFLIFWYLCFCTCKNFKKLIPFVSLEHRTVPDIGYGKYLCLNWIAYPLLVLPTGLEHSFVSNLIFMFGSIFFKFCQDFFRDQKFYQSHTPFISTLFIGSPVFSVNSIIKTLKRTGLGWSIQKYSIWDPSPTYWSD